MTESLWNFYLSHLSAVTLQEFLNYSSGFPIPALVPVAFSVLVNRGRLYLPACLSSRGGSSLSLPWQI